MLISGKSAPPLLLSIKLFRKINIKKLTNTGQFFNIKLGFDFEIAVVEKMQYGVANDFGVDH